MTIKDHIQGIARFEFLKDSALWYRTSTGLLFPIPLDDTKGATFEAEHKGIFLMRWIRKYLVELDAAKNEIDLLTKGDLVP